MGGTVVAVNEKFEQLMGYRREELLGQHASIFVDSTTRNSGEYHASRKRTWEKLKRGDCCVGEAKRTTKEGREIWIDYSYNPVLDLDGKPYKVVNYFRDITATETIAIHDAATGPTVRPIGTGVADPDERPEFEAVKIVDSLSQIRP